MLGRDLINFDQTPVCPDASKSVPGGLQQIGGVVRRLFIQLGGKICRTYGVGDIHRHRSSVDLMNGMKQSNQIAARRFRRFAVGIPSKTRLYTS